MHDVKDSLKGGKIYAHTGEYLQLPQEILFGQISIAI